MKKLFLIEDTISNKISYYHLALFLAALPFDQFYSELILISFGIHTVIQAKQIRWAAVFNKPVIIMISVFLLGSISILYSSNKAEGINIITRQLAILLLPVLLSINSLNLEKYRLNLFIIFGSVCTFTTLYLYTAALEKITDFHLPVSSLFSAVFMNHSFAMPLAMHATYLSVYMAFSLAVFLFLIFTAYNKRLNAFYIVAIIILSAGLLQLSSRAVFIAFLCIINIIFPLFLFKGKKRWLFFSATSALTVTFLIFIFSMNAFKERYISNLKTDLGNEIKIIENTEPRWSRWKAIGELISQSPVIGYGTGSEKELLKEKYFEKGLYISYLNELNAHNEYLSVMLKMGIFGLVLFGYVLYFGFVNGIQQKDVLQLSFLTIIVIVCISENFLELNKGIFFYSFCMSAFLLRKNTNRQAIAQVFPFKEATAYN